MDKKTITNFSVSLLITAIGFLIPLTSNSQWSSNPNTNLKICDVNGEQALTKITNTSDGGCYISWFDNRLGNYYVYLQRLNSTGIKQFATDGLLISSKPQNTSLVDYDMITDNDDNAVIVFTDIRNGGSINPFAYKINPQGVFLWDTNGVTLSDSFSVYQPNPKVEQTSDGSYVITWIYSSSPSKIAFQKLSSSGVKQWGNDPILLSGSGSENFTYPDLVSSDNGSVIVLWSGYSGSFLNPINYKLYSQKFSCTGSPVWNSTQDTAYHLGNVSGFYVPRIFPDGNNGAFYAWQDDRNSQNLRSSYVQHFTSDGTRLFPLNGASGSTLGGRNHFGPVVDCMQHTNETFMFWKETNTGQSQIGVYGQKFSSNGTPLWSISGKVFKPIDNNGFSSLACYVKDSSVIVYFDESLTGSTNNLIKAFKINCDGVMQWGSSILTASTILSEKIRLAAVLDTSGMSKLSWSDRRQDNGGIYAQNINFDGTLGNPTGIKNKSEIIPKEFQLFQNFPNPFNPVTKIVYAIPNPGVVNLKIYSATGKEIAVIVNEYKQAGYHSIVFDGSEIASGVYFCELKTSDYNAVKKMLLVK